MASKRTFLSRDALTLSGFLAPGFLGLTLLVIVPAVMATGLAFTSYDTLSPPVWRGFDTLGEVFRSRLFRIAAKNSLLFVLMAVPLRVIGALLLALLLNRRRRGIGAYRMAVFLPTVIPDVAYAFLWLWMLNPVYGPINALLRVFGITGPAWLADGHTALLAIVIMAAFQIGEGLVVFLVGLGTIPEECHQSAALDGATRWQRFRWITLPLLAPWLLLLTVRDVIVSAQSTFAPAFLMTEGGPYYATLFLPLLMYREAFEHLRFGHAAAIMLLLLAAVTLLLLLVAWIARRLGGTDHA